MIDVFLFRDDLIILPSSKSETKLVDHKPFRKRAVFQQVKIFQRNANESSQILRLKYLTVFFISCNIVIGELLFKVFAYFR